MKVRVNCQIIGCKRTNKNFSSGDDEWLCSKHWDAIPKKRRKFYGLMKRRFKAGKINHYRCWQAWEKIKELAHKNAWSV